MRKPVMSLELLRVVMWLPRVRIHAGFQGALVSPLAGIPKGQSPLGPPEAVPDFARHKGAD